MRDWESLDPELRRLFEQGVPYEEMAEKLEVPQMSVWRRCQKLGLSRTRELEIKHGTYRGYYIHKCPCDQCTEAMREAGRRMVGSTKETATRRRRPWTEDEEAAVLDKEKSVTEIAESLGRSYRAVMARRALLARPETKLPRPSDKSLASMDAARKERQAESLETATRSGYVWTSEELDIVMDYSTPTLEVAKQLGRTVEAVKNARKRGKQREGE